MSCYGNRFTGVSSRARGSVCFRALTKLRDRTGVTETLAQFGVPEGLTAGLAVLIPLAELSCAVALLVDSVTVWGAFGAIALLTIFTIAIAWNLGRGRKIRCRCFGRLSDSPISWRTLVRNLVLLGLAALIVVRADEVPGSWAALEGIDLQFAMLVAIGLLLAGLAYSLWFQMQVMQQNGRLLARLENVERRLGIDPNAPLTVGLPAGNPAPQFQLESAEGGTVSLLDLESRGKPVLLIFTEPGCHSCAKLLPDLMQWQRELSHLITIVPITSTAGEHNSQFRNTLIDENGKVANLYRIGKTPASMLIHNGKVVSIHAEGPEQIRTLVAHATLPKHVKKGDAAPEMRFTELASGNPMDLRSLTGRPTLLLIWSTTCGFCEQMLPYLRNWQDYPDAPDLVVISKGSVESNRAQGLNSCVLLDPYGTAQITFEAQGTPAAVLLDESGRLASDVVAGASSVLALVGIAGEGQRTRL